MLIQLMLTTALAAPVPEVTAGPELAEKARVVAMPIDVVTVFSDRAKVERAATVPLAEGIHTLRLPDLPGAVMLQSIRVSARGGKVLRVEWKPVIRQRVTIEQVEKVIKQIELLTDQLNLMDRKSGVLRQELNFLSNVSPRLPVDEAKRKVAAPLAPTMWTMVLDFFDRRRGALRTQLNGFVTKRRNLIERLTKLQREARRFDRGGLSRRSIEALAIVSIPRGGRIALAQEYYIPGAHWLPAYDIEFYADRGEVSIKTAGMVTQATGEDWNGVTLKLSTAIPGQGIALPELLTWTLGEKRELIPKPRAARWPQQPRRYAPPAPQPTVAEAERKTRMQILSRRLNHLNSLLSMNTRNMLAKTTFGSIGTSSTAGLAGLGLRGSGRGGGGIGSSRGIGGIGLLGRSGGGGKYGAKRSYRPRPKTRPPRPRRTPPPMADAAPRPPPAPPSRVMATPTSKRSYSRSRRSRRRRRGGRKMAMSRPSPRPGGSTGRAEGQRGPSARGVSLSLFEPTYYRRPSFSNPNLPAVTAGGLDYVYTCPTKATIPSTGKQLRVPLDTQTYPVTTYYEATPSLMETAFLKASVKNKSGRPILQGPANIFVGPDFAGEGRLRTTGPGGRLDFPLGADEDIRIQRKTVPATETKGVFRKDDITRYTITIEVANYKKKTVKVAIIDQVPKPRKEDIKIETISVTPKQAKGPTAGGIYTWDLTIPAGKTQKIVLVYTIKRPTNWQLTAH